MTTTRLTAHEVATKILWLRRRYGDEGAQQFAIMVLMDAAELAREHRVKPTRYLLIAEAVEKMVEILGQKDGA